MYQIIFTGHFKKSLKKCIKRGFNPVLMQEVVDILREKGELPPNYRPHRLHGNYEGYWECHIQPDWLLIWKQEDNELVMILFDTGTHSDLF